MILTVLQPGPYATVQDLGRPGHGQWGVPPGGAADRGSLRLANRLVGNPESAAAIEFTLGSADLTVSEGVFIAVTGAEVAVTIDGRAANMQAPQWVPAGARLWLGYPSTGLRTYLAVRGAIDTPLMLGSRSVDPPSGFGAALLAGDRLPIGAASAPMPGIDIAPVAGLGEVGRLLAVPGPRSSWCPPEALASFAAQTWTVGADSNRVGVRIHGEALQRTDCGELASEPAIRGAIELPPDGQPIIFMADHPTTCGYPIIAVLDPASADRCAQLRPGETIRFDWQAR